MEDDQQIRKNISGFLGSYKKDHYSQQQEIKVLTWPEIYFELGKLKDKTLINSDVDNIR